MKPYLIMYGTNYVDEKNRLMLIYGKSYKDAVKKLKALIDNGSRYIIKTTNLTIE
jgi:hypothetical protein